MKLIHIFIDLHPSYDGEVLFLQLSADLANLHNSSGMLTMSCSSKVIMGDRDGCIVNLLANFFFVLFGSKLGQQTFWSIHRANSPSVSLLPHFWSFPVLLVAVFGSFIVQWPECT